MNCLRWGAPIVFCLIGLAACAGPEREPDGRYYTWVDASGQVRHTRIADERIEDRVTPSGPRAAAGRGESEADSDGRSTAPDADDTSTSSSQSSRAVSSTTGESADRDVSAYTLENYPDGNELARQGFVREDGPKPYFTWRDATGKLRNTPYRPDADAFTEEAVSDGPSLTSARERVPQSGSPAPDPEALANMGVESKGPSLIARWQQACCGSLPVADAVSWDAGRAFGAGLVPSGPVHEFVSGESHYRLVSLPPGEKAPALVLRLRSYVRDGVVVPTLVFLDQSMSVRRLVTDIAYRFEPESWSRRGYLEARLAAYPAQGEAWLLILTRQDDQQGQTVYETTDGPEVIPHAATGEIGLRQVR